MCVALIVVPHPTRPAEERNRRLYEVLEPLLWKPELLRQQAAHSHRLGRPQAADAIVTTCLQLLGSPFPSGRGRG